jgi:hypothetical protein
MENTETMTRQTITAAILFIAAAFILATPASADIVLNLASYDSPNGYDFVTTFPGAGSTTIGTVNFTIPAGQYVTEITISGSFGNGDSPTTALSDYYLGFSGNETAVPVANCDDPLADCASNQNGPTEWSYTFTSSDINTVASALAAGSLDFTYTWDNPPAFASQGFDQYVYAGPVTIDITAVPEPVPVLLCFSAFAGIAALRRFRKV